MSTPYYKCDYCGKMFKGRARKYCNRQCRDAAYYQRKKDKEIDMKKFIVTGKIIQRHPRRHGVLEDLK